MGFGTEESETGIWGSSKKLTYLHLSHLLKPSKKQLYNEEPL